MPVGIITGASKGLGRALAGALAVRGWSLVLDGRDGDALAPAAAEVEAVAAGGRVEAPAGDVTDPAHREALVAAAERLAADTGGAGLDLLVNNASALGAEPLVPLAAHPLDGLRGALETNVVAPLALVQRALPLLRAAAPGRVLNVSSDAAVEAYETWGGYGASKAALDHLSAVLAVEHPELRVWWVDPGDMRTDLYAAAVPDDDEFAARPLPEAVAPALLRLLDEDAASGRYTAGALRERGAAA